MDVLLIGLRGSGKTTVGTLLAQRAGAPFVDLDDVVARHAGHPGAGAALMALGEKKFRAIEVRALGNVLGERGLTGRANAGILSRVIACGGGTPEAPGAAAIILVAKQQGAKVVYLRASVPVLQARMRGDATARPSLTGRGSVEEVEEIHARRDGEYPRLADVVVEVDGKSAAAVVEAVLKGVAV